MARILALIPARRDGTVTAEFAIGQGRDDAGIKSYVFQPDGAGNLVCEIEDKGHAEQLLKNPENFRRMPAAAEERAEKPGKK